MSDQNAVLLRAVFEISQDAIGVSSSGVHHMVNAAYLKLFGYENERELLGKRVLDLIDPAEHGRISEYIRRRSGGEDVPASYETVGIRKDGTTFDFEVHASRYEVAGEPFTLVILRDVTEQKRARRELLESQMFYQALFEENSAIKILVDPENYRVVNANGAACRFYGYSLEQLIGTPMTRINNSPPDVVAAAMRRCRNREQYYFTFQHRLSSGELRDVDIYSGPVQIGGRTLLLSIIHDVTERSNLQRQLLQAQKMEAVGKLAGGVAHDFNNLLTAIFANADLILEETPAGDPLRERAEQILSVGKRAETLVRQLLAFSRRQILVPQVLNLNEVLEDMSELLRRLIGETYRLEFELDPGLLNVRADRSQIEQVILNLVINAREAMPQGGPVNVRTRAVGDEVVVEVLDRGVGIPEMNLTRIFEPFFSTKAGGTGLGLATAYGIVRQSGGHLEVNSQIGKSTTFTLRLPAVDAPAAKAGADAGERLRPPVRSGTIMLVEDEEAVRETLAETLQAAGYRVIQADNGARGLEVFLRHADLVQAIVTDVRMPRMGGYEMAMRIREALPELPILFISGYSEELVNSREVRDPIGKFLQKPFTGKALLREVDLLMTGAKPAR